jgi:outer membrane receptor protein involved in Fe transport
MIAGALPARGQDASGAFTLPPVEVVGATPIDSIGVPLDQIPANAQRLGSRAVAEQGGTTVADLLDASLGSVTLSNGGGNPYQNDLNYRGFQASSLLGAPVGLSVWLDGVRMNEPFGAIVNWDLIPMKALSSLDVLPGSNPMFGLNTLGGAIVINTKNGKDNPGSSIGFVGGSFNRRAWTFETAGADAEHGTDAYITGNIDRQDGYRAHAGSSVKQLYAKLRWLGNGGQTRVELSGAWADTSLSGTQSLPMDLMADRSSAYTWPDNTANRMGLLNLKASHWIGEDDQLSGNLYQRTVDTRSLNSNAALDDGCFNPDGSLATQVSGGATIIKCGGKAPGGTALNSVTGANALALGYGRWGSSINTSLIDSMTRQNTIGSSVQWSRFADWSGHRSSFSLGALVDHSRVSFGQGALLARLIDYQTVVSPNLEYGFTTNGLPPSAGNPPAFPGSNLLRSVNLESIANNLAAYFTENLQLADRLSTTVSGSFNYSTLNLSGLSQKFLNEDGGYNWADPVSGASYYNPDFVNGYKYANSGSGAATSANGIPAGASAGPQVNGLGGRHQYHRFNPSLGFNYNLDPRTGFFGGYSESMRAPTAIELACADPASPCALPTGFNGDPDLKAVVARTLEAGARGRLGQTLDWNVAVYDSRIANDIQFIAASTTYGYFANVGSTERRGAELGLRASLDRLTLAINAGHVEARYRSAFTTAGGENVVSGNRIPGVPENSVKLRAAWAFDRQFSVGGSLLASGKQIAHGNESNSRTGGTVAGYSLVNLDAHYRINRELKLSGFITNLFDRHYSTYGLAGMTSVYSLVNQSFMTPAAPRALWVGLTWSFGATGSQ